MESTGAGAGEASAWTLFAQLALSGEPLTAVRLQPTDTVEKLRQDIAETAGEVSSLWLLVSGRLLADHETVAETQLRDRGVVEVLRCQPVPALAPPPAAPGNWRIALRCALTGDPAPALQLWPLETLAHMREAVARLLGRAEPVQLLNQGQLLVGPMSLMEAGLLDGTTVDVVWCEPRFLVTASADRSAGLWSAETGARLRTFEHTEWVNSAAASPDGLLVVTTLFDNTAKVWSLESGVCLLNLAGHQGPVLSGTFSPDCRMVATASFDRTAKFWSIKGAQCTLTLAGHTDGVNSVTFSPVGPTAVTASVDRSAKIWHLQSGECTHTLTGHEGEVRCASFSPDGTLVATASADHLVMCWSAATGECVLTLRGNCSSVQSAVFSPHSRLLVTAAADGIARIWDVRDAECKLVLSGHEDVVTSACFSPDGQLVATSSGDRTTRVWNVESGQCTAMLVGHRDAVMSASFCSSASCCSCAT